MTLFYDRSEISRFLDILFLPGEVRELRIPEAQYGTMSGYFNDKEELLNAAANISGNVPGVYITMNPLLRR